MDGVGVLRPAFPRPSSGSDQIHRAFLRRVYRLAPGVGKIEVDYLVVKNRLFRRTLQESSFKPLAEQCREQTAVAMVVGEDLPAALKVFLAFAEKNGGPVVLAAMWGGNIFSGSGIKRLAGLPGRRELLAQLLRGVQSPLSGFVGTLNGLLTGLVVALKGITEKKSEAAG